MSFDIPVRKQSPPIRIRVLPSLIPIRLGELRPGTIDGLQGVDVVDAIVVRGYTDNGSVCLMQPDIILLEMAAADFVEVPEFGEAGPEWSGDGTEGV